jgi:hypothetical protein
VTVNIDEFIINVVREQHPGTVHELSQIVGKKFLTSEEEVLVYINRLTENGTISLNVSPVRDGWHVLFEFSGLWFWITLILGVSSVFAVFVIPQDSFPLAYARNVLGAIFMIFTPGFCLLKALFPRKELGIVEVAALSILSSIMLVALTSAVLNFTSWGITVTPVTLVLFTQTMAFGVIGLVRQQGVRVA